jgi:hypothetical protein
VFDNGLTVSSCNSATLGSAIYIFKTTSNGGSLFSSDKSTINYSGGTGGLLLYMSPTHNGTVNISNSFSSSGLYDPPSGPYEGIVLWDASSGSLSFGQGTGGGSGPQWNGGIYAPVANPVQVGGGYDGFTVTFMVINNYTSNGSQTNISSG